MEGLHPYQHYAETSAQWLLRIPRDWEIRRNGRLFSERKETNHPHLPVLEVSIRTGVRVRKFDGSSSRKQVMSDFSKYKRAAEGDLAYNMMRMWQGAVGVVPTDGLVSPAYVVARPHAGTHSGYYEHVFRSSSYRSEVNKFSHGIVSDRNRLYWDEFKQMPSPYPPPRVQQQIARYVAGLDSQVRALISSKRTVLSALEGQRKAIALDLLRGVHAGTPKRASGHSWLGDIPRHWEVKRLKWVLRLQRGYDLPADHRREGTVPVISSGGVIGAHDVARASAPGIVIGRYGSTEAVFFVQEDYWPHNTALFTTTIYGNDPRWCFHLLRSISKADHSEKSAVPGVDRKDLFDIYVPCPPVSEQRQIADEIDARLALLDDATTALLHEVDLVREYRNRVVEDVVTGRLCVEGLPVPANIDDPGGEDEDSPSDEDGEEGASEATEARDA